MTEFKQITSTLVADKYQVIKYQFQCTGLTVILTQTEDSVVHCSVLMVSDPEDDRDYANASVSFCFPVTEPEDDQGYVHALEHLIFNGSQKYPFRGVLNKLDGDSVAWTEIDHTVFTLSATGQSQALAALPIFLDHIMFPLLTDEDYVLDVHHIDGEGKDGGLVYEEMKDAYDSPYKKLVTKLMKEVYPDSAYSYDYCGSESALRLSASNSKVKEFHKKYYRSENMTVLLTGNINHSDVLKVLAEFEVENISKRNAEPSEWLKPWQTTPPPSNYGEYYSYHAIDYPELDGHEKDGYMLFGWRGPVLSDATGLKELAACEILLDYLGLRHHSPLHKWLLDTGEPLAELIVSSNIDSRKFSLLRLELFHIPLELMEKVKQKTLEYLKNITTGVVSLDMDSITKLIENELKDDGNNDSKWVYRDIETKYQISLYLDTDEFAAAMNPQWNWKQLSEETVEYWLDVFRKFITDDVVIVNGIPTELEHEKIEEKQRIDKQRQALGKQGLAEKARLLERAKKYRHVRTCVFSTSVLISHSNT